MANRHKREYDGLIEMGTWKLVDLPKGRKTGKMSLDFRRQA